MGISRTHFSRSVRRFGVQRQVHGVDVLAAKGGVHHLRRQASATPGRRPRRRPWWRHPPARCGRHRAAILAVIMPGAVSSPGLAAAKVQTLPARRPEHAADDPLLAHAHADHGVRVAASAPGTSSSATLSNSVVAVVTNLVIVGGKLLHLGERLLDFPGGLEVVEGQDQRGPAAQALQVGGLDGGGALQFQVNQLTAIGGRLGEHIDSAASEPRNLPPLTARRQVAMATTCGVRAEEAAHLREAPGRGSSGSLT